MPRLSDSMEEGTILRWLRAGGDEVHRGEDVVEIETDKATMTYAADADGILEIVAQEGEVVAIGGIIARLNSNGDAAAAKPPKPDRTASDGEASGDGGGAKDDDSQRAEPATAEPAPVAKDGAPTRVKASPVARRLAGELGVELAAITGSGPGGRIVRADVEGAGGGSKAGPGGGPVEAVRAKGEVSVVELTSAQRTIARRMAQAKATTPEFTLQGDIDMERCATLRSELKVAGLDAVPTYTDMVVRAVALTLREQPRANGSYRDGHFELYSRVNVGVAVATEESLLVPTVFDADRLSLADIAAETRRLAQRARDGTITPPELSSGTFTVSSLGMFAVSSFTAVINPPQAAILAVGSIEPRAVVRDGVVAVRQTMSVTLACDHRILYGTHAAGLLSRLRELLEAPLALLV